MAKRLFIVVVRRLLLLVLLATVGGLGALFYLSAQRDEAPVEAGNLEPSDIDPDTELEAPEGMQFAVLQGERIVFQIHGQTTRSDREGNVLLESPEIEYPREDGTRYYMRGDDATYNRETQEARLENNVTIDGPDGLLIETDWLELRQQGNVLNSSQGTDFTLDNGIVGHSQNLRIDFVRDLFLLSEGVRLESVTAEPEEGVEDQPEPTAGATDEEAQEPFSLTADRVTYDRGRQVIRAQGGVVLVQGQDFLVARQMTVEIDELTGNMKSLRALWDVRARVRSTSEMNLDEQPIVVEGLSLDGDFDPDTRQARRLVIEGMRRRPAILRTQLASDPSAERVLRALSFDARFEQGVLQTVRGRGPVALVETSRQDGKKVERRVRGETAVAFFDARGQVAQIEVERGVRLLTPEAEASGDRAVLRIPEDRIQVLGEPVVLNAEQADLEAPEVSYSTKTGRLHAMGGVRAALSTAEGSRLASVALGSGEGPVRVVADEAFLRRPTEEFLFRGSVRAWQGENVLLAQQLRGESATSQMSASGGVKTLWRPDEEPAEAEGSEEGREVFGSRGPVEITSEHLSYDRGASKLLYHGEVLATRGGRRLRCQEMDVQLDPEDRAEVLFCEGGARLHDPAERRTVEGTRAIYKILDEEIEMFGQPLVLDDPQRGRMEGARLNYFLESGKFRMFSAASVDS